MKYNLQFFSYNNFYTSTHNSGNKSQTQKSDTKGVQSSPKIMSLWNRAIQSNKALLLDELGFGPDALLKKVEEFESQSQATVYSYPALILSSDDGPGSSSVQVFEKGPQDYGGDEGSGSEYDYDSDLDDSYEGVESSVHLGSLPVDLIAKQLDDF